LAADGPAVWGRRMLDLGRSQTRCGRIPPPARRWRKARSPTEPCRARHPESADQRGQDGSRGAGPRTDQRSQGPKSGSFIYLQDFMLCFICGSDSSSYFSGSGSDPLNLPEVLVVNDDRAPRYDGTRRELRAVDVGIGTDDAVIADGRPEN